MEPPNIDQSLILVLNYNGRELLAECLPSIVEAGARAPGRCAVGVVDNGSIDGSLEYLSECWPDVRLYQEPNRGLSSFNQVLARTNEDVVLLLNNDVKLDPVAVGPLLKTFRTAPDALFTAPQCWTFDGQTYEGMRTRVRMRFGLIQGLCRVPGHERHVGEPGLTAAAGPVLAVDRRKFLALGGYDPLYLPGRIEDLDLGFRGWMAGWKGYYVPDSVAYHQGAASFGPAFGDSGCDRLAWRNSLLFAWKNLSGGRWLGHLAWLPARVGQALASGHADVLIEAWKRLGPAWKSRKRQGVGRGEWNARQEAFFEAFGWNLADNVRMPAPVSDS
ncbi:hypothetical protein BH23PLA1_BH23PLA1_15710 [soil metagenome]